MKIGVIGERGFTLGFQLAGAKQIAEVTDANFIERFEELFAKEGIGIIIMDSKYFKRLPSRLEKKIEKAISPVVVSVSEKDIGGADLASLIKRCLGVDLWRQ